MSRTAASRADASRANTAGSSEQALLLQRERLLARSHELRRSLAAQTNALRHPPAWLERTWLGWQWLLAHPAWVAAGFSTVLILKPRRSLRWAGHVLRLALLWRRAKPLWTLFTASRR